MMVGFWVAGQLRVRGPSCNSMSCPDVLSVEIDRRDGLLQMTLARLAGTPSKPSLTFGPRAYWRGSKDYDGSAGLLLRS